MELKKVVRWVGGCKIFFLWILQQKYQLVWKYLEYQEMEVKIYLSKHMMYIATNWQVLCIRFTQNNVFCLKVFFWGF